jgi:hypothetical protein
MQLWRKTEHAGSDSQYEREVLMKLMVGVRAGGAAAAIAAAAAILVPVARLPGAIRSDRLSARQEIVILAP